MTGVGVLWNKSYSRTVEVVPMSVYWSFAHTYAYMWIILLNVIYCDVQGKCTKWARDGRSNVVICLYLPMFNMDWIKRTMLLISCWHTSCFSRHADYTVTPLSLICHCFSAAHNSSIWKCLQTVVIKQPVINNNKYNTRFISNSTELDWHYNMLQLAHQNIIQIH